MEKSILKKDEMKLVGLTVRTNNSAERDQNGKIFPCVQRYFHHNMAAMIPKRLKPGTTYCAYTNYESDYTGDYTYFIGEQVESIADVPDSLETLIIPAQTYVKFTNGPGAMPTVLREAWEQIWKMPAQELGGKRAYKTDFEIYDERASNHQSIILDICIGIL